MKLLLGTRNPGKLAELKALLEDVPSLCLATYAEQPFALVEETGTTFVENARLKARSIAAQTGLAVLAEDAGLEVDALDRAPGVRSARFSGEPVDHSRNNALLLDRLQGRTDRLARFVAVACLHFPDGMEILKEGVLEGRIAESPAGEEGFGYDPLFIPSGDDRTLAEMSREEKNRISHRRRAIEQVKEALAAFAAGVSQTG